MVESPVQKDNEEWYKTRAEKDIAVHYGESSSNPTPRRSESMFNTEINSFVGGGGPFQHSAQNSYLEKHDKPFWIQLRGTKLSECLAIQLAAVFEMSQYPPTTRSDIYDVQFADTWWDSPTQGVIEIDGTVNGLGCDVDWQFVKKHSTDTKTPGVEMPSVRIELGGNEITFSDRHEALNYIRDYEGELQPDFIEFA
jgi:hypothetical protein